MKPPVLCLGAALLFFTSCMSHYYSTHGDMIRFYLKDDHAKSVCFQYSHDGYRRHEASRDRSGLWQVTVPSAREFSYFYLVDGRAYVPSCRFTEPDGFGHENCFYMEGL